MKTIYVFVLGLACYLSTASALCGTSFPTTGSPDLYASLPGGFPATSPESIDSDVFSFAMLSGWEPKITTDTSTNVWKAEVLLYDAEEHKAAIFLQINQGNVNQIAADQFQRYSSMAGVSCWDRALFDSTFKAQSATIYNQLAYKTSYKVKNGGVLVCPSYWRYGLVESWHFQVGERVFSLGFVSADNDTALFAPFAREYIAKALVLNQNVATTHNSRQKPTNGIGHDEVTITASGSTLQMNFKNPNHEAYFFKLLNIQGKQVMLGTVREGASVVVARPNGISSGLYTVVLQTGNRSYTQKVLFQR